MQFRIQLSILGAALSALCGCASTTPVKSDQAAAEPLVHEYRTGSLIVQKEKHVTTEQERQEARDIADRIRATPAGAPSRP